ncbi:MAG: hypothetical protein DRQ42_00950 [Gammaproteobacteria bacterium]|nr:MAG: hypothetical protein DRQ46_08910 [Gammaproteobacteria bacterium]RLA02338.1 MAG: hypothetical protein DRQ42_00950 [Gammaproteobacteria bacterium]
MDVRIKQLIDQIKLLEDELTDELHQQEDQLLFQLKGKKVRFEQSIKQAHRKFKTDVWQWLFGLHPINLITAPIIYTMIVPLVVSDLFVSFYQAVCFPVYKITKVRRGDFIIIDHHQLAYLNIFEKFHCVYCSYANGLISYIQEILARTEQYFCPIKHAHKVLGSHSRYHKFMAYGDAENYHDRLEKLRSDLAKEE